MVSCRVFVIDVESKRYYDQLHLLFWRNKLIEEKCTIVFIIPASAAASRAPNCGDNLAMACY